MRFRCQETLSSINTYLSSPDSGRSQSPRGCSPGQLSIFLWNNAHSEKFAARLWKKGSRRGGFHNPLENNEHSGKALFFLSLPFTSFHSLSLPFTSFHFLSVSFSFFHFLSFSFIFFPSFLLVFFFSGAQNPLFCIDCLTISD